MNGKVMAAISTVVIATATASSLLVWSFYRYETSVLSLTYQTDPICSSPLSDADYSWTAKAYSARIFGNSPFDGKGYVHRERIVSENRFRYTEFYNLNASLRLRFQITNATGYVLCNQTIDTTDGCDREVTFEFNPELAMAGTTLKIRVTLSLTVHYEHGSAREAKQFSLEKEWTKMIQVQQSEPIIGEQF